MFGFLHKNKKPSEDAAHLVAPDGGVQSVSPQPSPVSGDNNDNKEANDLKPFVYPIGGDRRHSVGGDQPIAKNPSSGASDIIEELTPDSTELIYVGKKLNAKTLAGLSKSLSEAKQIQLISLVGCEVDNDGCKSICEALIKSKANLVQLDLRENKIGENGAKHIKELLRVNSSIKVLSLSRNKLENSGMRSIGKGLSMNSSIVFLDVSKNNVGDSGVKQFVESIEGNTTLKSVDFSGNVFEEDGAKYLGAWLKINSSLEQLNLAGCPIKKNGGVELCNNLKKNKGLVQINLEACSIANKGAVSFAEVIKDVESLMYFNLAKNVITDAGMSHVCEALSGSAHVLGAELGSSVLGDPGCRYISALLETSPSLMCLSLESSGITDQGAQYLATSLFSNLTLRRLGLSGNMIGNIGASAIAQSLSSNTVLNALDMSTNQIGEDGGVAFQNLLLTNKTLTELSLADNPIPNAVGDRIAAALVFAPNLKFSPMDPHSKVEMDRSKTSEIMKMFPHSVDLFQGEQDGNAKPLANHPAHVYVVDFSQGVNVIDPSQIDFPLHDEPIRVEIPADFGPKIAADLVPRPPSVEPKGIRVEMPVFEEKKTPTPTPSSPASPMSKHKGRDNKSNEFKAAAEEKKENIADRCLATIKSSLDATPQITSDVSSSLIGLTEAEEGLRFTLDKVKSDVLQGPSAAIAQKSTVVFNAMGVNRPWERSASFSDPLATLPKLATIICEYPLVEQNMIHHVEAAVQKFKDTLKNLDGKVLEIQKGNQLHQKWLADPSVTQALSLHQSLKEGLFNPEEPILIQKDLVELKESGQWLRQAGEQYLSVDDEVRKLLQQLQQALDKKKSAVENFSAAIESFVANNNSVTQKTESTVRRLNELATIGATSIAAESAEKAKKSLQKRIASLDDLVRFFKRFEEVQQRLLDIDDQISNKRRDIEVAKNRKKPYNEIESQLQELRQNSEDLRVQARLDINLQIDDCVDDEDKCALRQFFKEFLDDGEPNENKADENRPKQKIDCPDEFLCPISYQLMQDPVMISEAEDGVSYERSAIEEWLKKNGTNPLSREPVSSNKLTPNRALKALIDNYKSKL
jgi:Ran GTPase-activating protein (RanGAP) involved in mRNA processing and transport